MLVFFAGLQNGGGEIRLVGSIREELCFQTESVAGSIGAAAFSGSPMG